MKSVRKKLLSGLREVRGSAEKRHGGGRYSHALNNRPFRAIGETMQRSDVLIALRKASESRAAGKGENNEGDVS